LTKTPVGLHLIGLHALNDPVFIERFPITLVFPVPEVKNLSPHKAVLSLNTEVAESKYQICVFVPPTLEGLVKPVNLKKILSPDPEITASDTAPSETLFYPE